MSKEIASTILAQLGGNKFCAMTGAKNLGFTKTGLVFKLPSRFAKSGINHVEIALNGFDTYTLTFSKIWGTTFKTISRHTDVYCDMLQDVFTNETGVECIL